MGGICLGSPTAAMRPGRKFAEGDDGVGHVKLRRLVDQHNVEEFACATRPAQLVELVDRARDDRDAGRAAKPVLERPAAGVGGVPHDRQVPVMGGVEFLDGPA